VERRECLGLLFTRLNNGDMDRIVGVAGPFMEDKLVLIGRWYILIRLTSSFARHFDSMDLRCKGQMVGERAKARVTRVGSAASLNDGLIRTSAWLHTLRTRVMNLFRLPLI
jgi:hypothetical protein